MSSIWCNCEICCLCSYLHDCELKKKKVDFSFLDVVKLFARFQCIWYFLKKAVTAITSHLERDSFFAKYDWTYSTRHDPEVDTQRKSLAPQSYAYLHHDFRSNAATSNIFIPRDVQKPSLHSTLNKTLWVKKKKNNILHEWFPGNPKKDLCMSISFREHDRSRCPWGQSHPNNTEKSSLNLQRFLWRREMCLSVSPQIT